MNSPSIHIEIGQTFFRALSSSSGLDLPLERSADGRLTPACRERLGSALNTFLNRKNWQSHQRAWCAIGARGVSLRRMTLPSAGRDELRRLLELQIESEFPLSPSELAWGYCRIGGAENGNGPTRQEVLVMAVRKEAVQDYFEILQGVGVDPVFTVAALARSGLCSQPPLSYAVLNVSSDQSELAVFEQGAPTALRVLPGSAALTADTLSDCLGRMFAGTLYITGASPVSTSINGERLEFQPGPGRTAATEGLQKLAARTAPPSITLQLGTVEPVETKTRPGPWKWAAVAAILGLALVLTPYVVALIGKPILERKLAALKADRGRLAVIDRELGFLQYLKSSQAPYVDALYLIADAAPPGAKFESINMGHNGEVSLRGSMKDGQQVNDFRAKMINSGFFANVVIEEQVPTPDRQKVNVRITTQWKSDEARERLQIGPKIESEAKTNSVSGGASTNALAGKSTNTAVNASTNSGSNAVAGSAGSTNPPKGTAAAKEGN